MSEKNTSVMEGKRGTVMALLVIMSMFGTSMVAYGLATALVSIGTELNAMQMVAWLFTGSTLVNMIIQPLVPALNQKFSLQKLVIFGCCIDVVATLLMAISPNIIMLILSRTLGGLAGGLLYSGGFSLAASFLPQEKRASVTGWNNVIGTVAAIVSPLLAGAFCDMGKWRIWLWIIFAVDIAITAAIIILCPKETKEQEQKRVSAAKAGFDFKGVVLLTIAFLSLGLELQLSGSYWKWTSGISIGLVVIFIAAIVVFVILERKREAENKSVAFQISLFKNKLFVLSALSGLFITISTNGFSTYLPSFTQEVMNLSATVSGLATALTNIAGLVSGLAVGYVYGTKRWFKSFTAIAAVIATLASWALFGLGDKLTPTLFIILTVFGRGLWNTFLASISMVVVQTFAKESELVSFTSGIGTLTVVGAYLGIAVNSAIINLTGYAGMFITAGIVTLLGLLCILVIRIPKQEELS